MKFDGNILTTADPATSIPASEEDARRIIAPVLAEVGIDADWPFDLDTAARILSESGYDIEAGDLERLGKLGQVPSPGVWDARDVLAAAVGLDARRQWRFGSSLHEHKMHATMRDLGRCLEAGEAGIATLDAAFRGLDLKLALVLLAEAPSRESRERLLTAVTYLLARDHQVIL